jgi:AcrR family transcriptional regulator
MPAIRTTQPRVTPRRRTQAERSEATQRKVIQSALRLLEKVGFQRTNLQLIARGAEVTLGALQHQFGSRQALMERVVDEVMAPLGDLGSVWPVDAVALPLEGRAREFVRLAWEHVYGRPSYVAAWSLFFGCKTTPKLFKRIDRHRAKIDPLFFQHFVAVFPEIARRHPQTEHFAALVFATLRGVALMRLFEIDESDTRAQLESLIQIIVQAGR